MVDMNLLLIAIIFIGILITRLWLKRITIVLENISSDLKIIREFLKEDDDDE